MSGLYTSPVYSGAGVGSFNLDALTDFVAFRHRALAALPIIKVEWYCTTKLGTPGNLGVVLCADNEGVPNVSAGVPVDIGGGSPTLATLAAASISNNTRTTTTFANAYTPAAGDYIWVVIYPIAATYDGSNLYAVRRRVAGFTNEFGEEQIATSTDTGSTWTRDQTAVPSVSYLTTGDAYLPTFVSTCPDGITNGDFDDADNPDERGVAWTNQDNTTTEVFGLFHGFTVSALTADFNIGLYLGDSPQSSRSIDSSKLNVAATIQNATLWFDAPPIIISTPGTLRAALKATHGTATIRVGTINFGTQARRESAYAFRYFWYCTQNGGGGFTDDLTRYPTVLPNARSYGKLSSRASYGAGF